VATTEQKQTVFDLTRELLEILWKVDRKSPTSMVLAGLSGVGSVRNYINSKDTLQRRVEKMGLQEEYTAMRSFLYASLIHLCGHPEVVWAQGDMEMHEFNVQGDRAYFVKAKNDVEANHGVYLTDTASFRRKFRRLFWEKQGGSAVTLLTRRQHWAVFITPQPWMGEPGAVVGKPNLDTLMDQLQPFIDQGVGSTIIIAGQPGTGKTSLARQVAERRGKVLRVTPETMEYIPAPTFIEITDLVAPDVLLLDDFDRAGSWWTTRFLEQIESLNEQARTSGRLVIATVNSLKSMDPALKRPGRFDRLVVVNLPDQTERRDILAHYIKHFGVQGISQQRLTSMSKKTEGMTGAYLRLLCERLSVYGVEHLKRELEDIRQQFELCHDFEESKYIHDLLTGALTKQREEGGAVPPGIAKSLVPV